MVTLSGGAFVGRQQEMGKLKVVLEDALCGQGQLLMLAGEPGIGKTRTTQELAAYAETRGTQVLWGWCYEEEGAPPFWPWLQPIRAYVQQRDPEQLQSEIGPGAADIAEVVSEVRGKLPNLEPPPALPPEQARFRLFDSITTFLKNAAQSQPLMLVLDDLHWADKPSLLLLQFLARQLTESHLLVVGCYRDVELSRQHPLSEVLAQLSRLPVFQRELLLGISQEDTSQFIEMMAGIRPSLQLVEAIHAHTEGNPLFLKEMTRLLSERGELRAAEIAGPEGIRIPQGVREVIGQRLNRLSESCHQTLTIASIIGREFDFRLLRTLHDEATEEQLLGVIDEALAAHVVEELPGGRERYRFSHMLIQQTLAEELSSSRKVRWHAWIGEALEDLYGADVEAHAAELVYHFAKAESVLGMDKLVHYSLLAGEQALATFGYEEALAHFQRGLAAKGGSPVARGPAGDTDEAALLSGLGRVQLATLDPPEYQEALTNLARAFDYYAEVGDVDGAVAIAVYPFYPLIGQHTGINRLIASALDLVPPESRAAGQLLSRHARIIGIEEGNYNGAREAFARALSIAQLEGDVVLEIRILADAANVDMLFWQHRESLEKNKRAIELVRRVDEPHTEALARYTSMLDQLALGDLPGMRLQAPAVLATAERLRDRFWLTMALRANEDIAHLVGDWQTARGFSNRGLQMSPRECRNLCTRAILEYQTGDSVPGETYLHRLVEVMRSTPPGPTNQHAFTAMAIPLVTCISGRAGLLDVAEVAAETVLSSPSRTGHMDLFARIGLAMLAVYRNEAMGANEHYASLKAQRGIMVPFAMIAADRVLGLLAQTMGNLEQAMAHFEDALAFCRKAGYRPELAWTGHDYADALLQHNGPGHRARASTLLDEASSISSELGMCPLMERVVTLRERMETQPPGAMKYPANLTLRQVEVLRLLAEGKTNREIGRELVLSERTVQHHISDIYVKIGARNRADATAFALSMLHSDQ
jgi:DNA-binding CsgD family transcriptional regulator/tetratricopeptide (TPR) repeat protein